VPRCVPNRQVVLRDRPMRPREGPRPQSTVAGVVRPLDLPREELSEDRGGGVLGQSCRLPISSRYRSRLPQGDSTAIDLADALEPEEHKTTAGEVRAGRDILLIVEGGSPAATT